MNRSLVFTPGCDWKIDRRILFVEYETVTGKPMSKRFDLSAETEYIVDGYKTLSFDEISKPDSKLQYSIKRIVYFEKECNSMVAFVRGCRQTKLLIPTRIEFDTIIHVPKESPNVDSDRVKMINQRIARVVANSAYGIVSRDWADVLADSARYIYAKQYKGVKSITPKPMHFRGRTWTHPESSYGKKGHMLIVDINSKTFIPDDDYLDVEVGDVMWYDDGNDGKNEPDDHGKLFVWLGLGIGWKKVSDDNGYFDTDTASSLQAKLMNAVTNSWSGISFSDRAGADFDGDIVKRIKLFEEEIKMAEKTRFDMYKPKISKVIFNDPATIVFWSDGSKTIVKCGENDDFDPEKGIAMACMKKLLGTNKTGSNYLDDVKKYISKWEEDNTVENIWTKLFCELGKMTGEDLVNTDAMDIPEEAENQETTEGGENNDEA